MINGGVVKLDVLLGAPRFYLLGREVGSVICYDVVRYSIMVYHAGDQFITGWQLAEAMSFASIHFVNLSTMTSKYFLLVSTLRSSSTR